MEMRAGILSGRSSDSDEEILILCHAREYSDIFMSWPSVSFRFHSDVMVTNELNYNSDYTKKYVAIAKSETQTYYVSENRVCSLSR